jgi:hypothetical protein
VQISFPIAWFLYAVPKNWEYINFIHFLAPFIVLGIGLDDIFVFCEFFEATRPYTAHFALDTRLTNAFMRSAGACLATSTTSAFAFAANIFSPVPAVQSFGLLLATIIVVNYICVITWIPVCLALWDRYILHRALRRAANGKSVSHLGCCLETGAADAAKKLAVQSPDDLRILEYGRLAWPMQNPPPAHRLAAPEPFREPVRVSGQGTTSSGAFRERVIGAVFDFVWRLRWFTIALVVVLSIMGFVFALKLTPPPTSEPPLFHKDHNVQFFYRYLNSEEFNNQPTCSTCKQGAVETFSDKEDVLQNPEKYFKDGNVPVIAQSQVPCPVL